jgi:hypothetical protein
MLSSEPAQFPIEPHVVEIVYELNALGLVQPYWSCEGHLNELGEVVKLPQIWFYSCDVAYTDLLVAHLEALKFRRAIKYEWQIHCLGQVAGPKDGTTYCLGPVQRLLPSKDVVSGATLLEGLRSELLTIAGGLQEHLRSLAQEVVDKIRT